MVESDGEDELNRLAEADGFGGHDLDHELLRAAMLHGAKAGGRTIAAARAEPFTAAPTQSGSLSVLFGLSLVR